MRIHHLNCGTLCPSSARFVTGDGGLFERARMVCHCLLLETPRGLVLVDTGLGTRDVQDAKQRLGGRFVARNAPRLELAETALAQVERLGFQRGDVRHIVPTHMDLDHIGGLADFPEAQVHVFGDEHDAALVPPKPGAMFGYRPVQWEHGPKWNRYAVDGERWFGFESVRVIPGLDAEVLLVPLAGHTAGHCGVAVKGPGGWVLHAGDAYFSHHEVDPVAPRSPWGVALFQRLRSVDNAARLANQERLRELVRAHGHEVKVFSAHCAVEFERLRGGPAHGAA
ncbi:MBL fold metallo-hydrolase [Corallococcus sp. Z5C101001]|uniref:MBL fold metallo-hydrolase n=1 Tax=Corallococcus sp. Z5C101001 TaxID=2596829 RepID=UPI00117C2C6C|nr:MBL fold metallo-hydrolase [Corallococcus sp. Z5C101001]TSC26828.1 MBL fold metallo-hydrolase [Corallococcus sp. Z5C101001]